MTGKDNNKYFMTEVLSKLYYTGNVGTFPSTIALNKLYYFMPHIKGKGVHPDVEDDKAPRLVFELEYLESLPEYKMINLNFQHAFTDTFLGRVIK